MLRILALAANVFTLSYIITSFANDVPYGYTLFVIILTIISTGLATNVISELRESRENAGGYNII